MTRIKRTGQTSRNATGPRLRHYGLLACALGLLLVITAGCATTSSGIVVLDECGREKPITPEEVAKLGGENPPYLLQIGDEVSVAFRMATVNQEQASWDYRVEPGDQLEVKVSADVSGAKDYLIDVGDIIGVGFLDNWQLNVTRTVRVDGKITAPEIGDVQAAGITAEKLRDNLKGLYAKSGLIQGDPKITVNVDFVNLDRFEDMSTTVLVRPNGAITLPKASEDIQVAGLTVKDACAEIEKRVKKVMCNPSVVSLNIIPAMADQLAEMNGVYQVRSDGKIGVPRIGDVQAAGYSSEEFQTRLAKACTPLSFNPIEPLTNLATMTGSRLYVGGEVRMPGVYPLNASPTALQALIMAQGLTNDSRMCSVVVMRRNPDGPPFVIRTNLRAAVARGHTQNDITLRPFDIVFVPQKRISKVGLFVEQYIENVVPFQNSLGVNLSYYMNEQEVDTKSRSKNFGFNTGVTGITDVLNP